MTITEQVLGLLAHGPQKVSDIAESLDLQPDQVSVALSAQRKLGVVVKDGQRRPFTWRLADPSRAGAMGSSSGSSASARKRRAPEPEEAPGDGADAPEIFVGRLSTGDVQIGVGEEALRISFDAAREIHALLANIVEGAE